MALRFLTIDEAAVELGRSRSYVYVLVRRGELRAVRFGRHWRVDVEDLEAHRSQLPAT